MSPAAAKGLAVDLVHLDDADEKQKLVLVPLDYIENLPRVDELRMDEAEFKQLCDSIQAEGLHEPIGVRTIADGLYRLVYGRHRAVAHAELGLDVVPALIRDDLDDGGEAVATALENLQRKNLRPYEEAEAYQAALDVDGMTQVKLAKRLGVSQGQISKRLKLLDVPKQIALAAGDRVSLEDLLWFAPVGEWPALVPPVAKELEKTLRMDTMRLDNLYRKVMVIQNALCDGKKAWAPFRGIDDIASIEQAGWSAKHWIQDNATFRKDVYALERVLRFGPEKSPDLVVVLDEDVKKAKEAAERALQRYQAQMEKESKGLADEGPAASHGSAMTAAEKRAKRVQNKARKLQLESMVEHVKAQDGFDEELVRFAYKEFLSSVGQVASRKVEQQALADILAEYAPPERKTSWGVTEKPLARGCPELVDQLWDKDRVVLDRYVAAVVHLHAGGYDHHVTDAKVHKFTTGKTPAAVQKAAERAVDGPKQAKKPKEKKPAKKTPAKKKAAKAPESPPKRPGAAVGKECPECKAIVEKKGRGKTARLSCFCTPEEGVPAEMKA